jgi:methyl-accepting chemotaxis protein
MLSLTLHQKQIVVAVVAVGGIFGLGHLAASTLAEVQIGGPIYQRIDLDHQLVAEYAPPHAMNAYQAALDMAGASPQRISELAKATHEARKDFEKATDAYRSKVPPGPLHDLVVERLSRDGNAMFDAIDGALVPAAMKGDKDAITKAVGDVTAAYQKYDADAHEVVAQASQRAAADEDEAGKTVAQRGFLLLVARGVLIAALGGLLLVTLLDLRRRLAATIAVLKKIAAGDFSEKLESSRADEIGDIARGLNEVIESQKTRERETAERLHREQAASVVAEVGSVLDRVAARDLTARASGQRLAKSLDEHGDKLAESLNGALSNMDDALAQVSSAAEQVSAAAGEISAGGQSLARATSRNAGSIEEVTSSLQEMSSMAQQNATHAHEARSLAEAAQSSAERGAESMLRLSRSVEKIKSSADETAKIVKTIDDIAFQTNLLALNAAVEAARAGDAGRGFAVVAEEVRNLAMRSAEAAKTTASMIDGSVRNADEGVSLNREVLTNLGDITTQVRRVVQVMAEIAAASEQQRVGATQINRAVEDMSRLTQQNAATSEESASTAEELASQAKMLLDLVSGFRLTHGRRPGASAARSVGKPDASKRPSLIVPAPEGYSAKSGASIGHAANGTGRAAAKAFIPFDDDGALGEF